MPAFRRLRNLTGPLALAGLFSCSEQAAPPSAPPPAEVTVTRPTVQPVTDYLEFTGTTEAANQVELRARVQGFLDEILFSDGASVEAGQVLFRIEPQTLQAESAGAQAQREEAEARLTDAQADFERYSSLHEEGVVSDAELDQVRATRDAAREQVNAGEAAVSAADLNLSYTEVRTPISGRVGRHLVELGALVGAGEPTLLATVLQDDPMHVYFNLNERDLLDLRAAAPPAELSEDTGPPISMGLVNEEGFPHEGRVDFADLGVDPETGNYTVRASFPNDDGRLLPGLFARLRAPRPTYASAEAAALLIPERAIGLDQRGNYVLVVDTDNKVQERIIELGESFGDHRVVADGLSPEEWIITEGLQRVRPGAQVSPERVAPAPVISEDASVVVSSAS